MKYYDEEGNEVEATSKEELDKILAEEREKVSKETEEKYAKDQEELEKLRAKDYNFKRLRDLTKDEKERLSAQELAVMQKQEELEERVKNFEQKTVEGHKEEILASLVGSDKDLREKVLFHYDRIRDEAKNRQEVVAKLNDAFKLAKGIEDRPNPINAVAGTKTSAPLKEYKSVDPETAAFAQKFGITPDKLGKK